MSKKLVIFDADSMIFTVAWKFRDKNVKAMVTMHLNKFIGDVIVNSGATHYLGFFGSKKDGAKPNFRYGIDPNYKLNRPETPEWVVKWRPILFEAMENKWKFVGVDGMEADDAVAIAAKYYKNEFDDIVVAACDKDLQQIPGIIYYNYQKHEMHPINAFDAAMNLGIQTLMGDATDNIKGLDGMGPKKAAKVLSECTTVAQIKWTVARMYAQHEKDLRTKAENAIFADLRKEMLADPDNDFSGMNDKQIDRQVRIAAKKRLESEMMASMPGGWKKYLRTQMSLVTLLTEAPADFIIPEPVESTLKATIADDATIPDAAIPNDLIPAPVVKPKQNTIIDNFFYL
jgi:DNA polymerase-1